MTPVDIKPKFTKEDFINILNSLYYKKDMVVFETLHKRKDGSLYNVEARVQLMKINHEDMFVAIVMDITERKEREKVLKEHQKLLLQQSRMAAMGEMIGNIAHQWRQPLNTISTISSGLKLSLDLNTFKENETKESLDKLVEVTQHLSTTIDDFRNFFKPNKTIEKFSLESVYKKDLSILGSTLRNKDIEVLEEIEDVHIKGFFNEVTQAILNILNNAKDALEMVKHKRLIFVNIYKEKEYGIISIQDNAGGIKEEIINQIFEPYFTTKQESNGTGIGLYMTEQIIEKHMKGKVLVENIEFPFEDKTYKGCKFTIKIPMDFEIK